MSDYRTVRDLDWPLLIISFIICGFGVVQIFSATRGTIWHDAWWKQMIFICGGVLLMWMVTLIDYHALLHHVTWMYVLAVVGLLGTLLIGREAFGSRRWIPLFGGFVFQVSEFVKLVIVLLVARFLTDLKSDVLEARDMLKIIADLGLLRRDWTGDYLQRGRGRETTDR